MPMTSTHTHVLWTGDFGERVAGHMESTEGWPTLRADVGGRRSAEWPHATRMRLVATWRFESALFEHVARLHAASRTPWLPVVYEYPNIRVGPLVVPGEGPCHSCYLRRRDQHDRAAAVTSAVRASLAADAGSGVAGFTDGQARIAAGLARDLLERYRAGAGVRPGQVLFYNVLTRALIGDTAVGVHGCRHCGVQPHVDDGWKHLADDLMADAEGVRR